MGWCRSIECGAIEEYLFLCGFSYFVLIFSFTPEREIGTLPGEVP